VNGLDSGHVRIYSYVNNSWQQLGADIDGEAAGDYSGESVSLSSDGTIVAIGAIYNDVNRLDSGHVRIYNFVNNSWQQLGADIYGEAATDSSGYPVSLSSDGSIVAIGAIYNDENGLDSGHVRIYSYVNNSWQQLGADIDGEAAGDYSGFSVSLSGDGANLIIGAITNIGNGSASAGHARVFKLVAEAEISAATDYVCAAGDAIIFNIELLINDHTELKIYDTDPSVGMPIAIATIPLVAGTTSYSYTATVSANTTYYARGEGGATLGEASSLSINVGDTVAPVPDTLVLTDFSNCTSTVQLTDLTIPTASDVCDGAITATTNAVFPITTDTTITWSYTDAANNTTTQDQIITLDTAGPVISTQSITVNAGISLNAGMLTTAATDNCTDAANLTYSFSPASFDCSQLGLLATENQVHQFSQVFAGNQNYGGTLGEDLTVLAGQNLTITQLGVFDDNDDGIIGPIYIDIYDKSTQTKIPGTNMVFTGGSDEVLKNGYRFKPLATPLVLPNGNYMVVAYGFSDNDKNGNSNPALSGGLPITYSRDSGNSIFSMGIRFNAGVDQYPGNTSQNSDFFAGGTFLYVADAPSISVQLHANIPADGDFSGNQDWAGTVGGNFTLTEPVTIDKLGVFDDGINGRQSAGVFTVALLQNQSGTRVNIAELTIGQNDGDIIQGYLFKSLPTPIVIPAGEYTIAAHGFNSQDRNSNTVNVSFNRSNISNNTSNGLFIMGSSQFDVAATTPIVYPTLSGTSLPNGYPAATLSYKLISQPLVTVTDAAGNSTTAPLLVTVVDAIAPVITLNGNAVEEAILGVPFIDSGTTITDNCDATVLTAVVAGDVVDVNTAGSYTITYNFTDLNSNAATEVTRTVNVTKTYVYESGAWTPNDPSHAGDLANFDDNVIIREDVTIPSNFRANNLTIETGATLTLGANVEVLIDNNINALGTLEASNSRWIAYGQTAANTWDIANANIGVLDLANATLSITGTYRINESIFNDDTASTSVLNITGASVTLGSTATRTALIDGSQLTVIGDLTVEQYYKDRRAFRFVSSPVTTTTSIYENWQENGNLPVGYGTHITGNNGANGFDVTGSNNPSMFGWDNINQTFSPPSGTNDATDVLVAGQYARLLIRGDRNIDLTSNLSSGSTTLRTKGQLLNVNYTLPSIASTDGNFIIVGNPYQSKLPLGNELNKLFNLAATNINAVKSSFYFVWDPMANTRGAYRTYGRQLNQMIGATPANSDYDEAGFLQPGQSAFMVASGVSAASFVLSRPSNAITPPPTSIAVVPQGELKISLYETSQFAQGSGSIDGMLVRFENAANNGVDTNDAIKFSNLDENLGRLHTDGSILSVESRGIPQHGELLPLELNNYRQQNYTLEFAPVGFMAKQAILKDNYTNTLTDLDNNQNTVYSYSVDPSDALSIATNRFEVLFEDVTLSVGDDLAFAEAIAIYPNPVVGTEFFINFANQAGVKSVTLYNSLGQKVNSYTTSEIGEYQVNTEALATGIYLLQIEKGDSKFVSQLIVK
jgi:hypothetical protein